MAENRFYAFTSLFLIAVLGYLVYLMLKPFLIAISWAIVFAIVFYPLYAFLRKYVKSESLASTFSMVIIVSIIIGPFTYLSFVLVNEVGTFVGSISKESVDSAINKVTHSRLTELWERYQQYFGMESTDGADAIATGLRNIGQKVVTVLSAGVRNVAEMFFDFVVMLFALFFFLRDGPDFLSVFRDYLPFTQTDKNRLINRVKDMVVSTVYGGVLVAVVQGILGGTAFYFLGISAPVLWGSIMTIMSFVPWFGTLAVWGPIAIYLLIKGAYIKGVVLLLYGALVIGSVDNVLRPIIISGRTKMPTLAVFFSVLGGIQIFGLIGLIMGPLILALFISVFEIFRHVEGG